MTRADLTYINSPQEHDAVIAEADRGRPTVICLLNDATPVCKAFEPKFKDLAARYADTGVRFCVMYFNNTTSMMFKFAPNQLPITPLMVGGRWCRTVTGPEIGQLEVTLKQVLEQAKSYASN